MAHPTDGEVYILICNMCLRPFSNRQLRSCNPKTLENLELSNMSLGATLHPTHLEEPTRRSERRSKFSRKTARRSERRPVAQSDARNSAGKPPVAQSDAHSEFSPKSARRSERRPKYIIKPHTNSVAPSDVQNDMSHCTPTASLRATC